MKWTIFILMLSTANAAVPFWIPHEKEIWTLIRKAERTPEFQMELRAPKLEKTAKKRGLEIAVIDCSPLSKTNSGFKRFSSNSQQNHERPFPHLPCF